MTRSWLIFVALSTVVGIFLSCVHTWIWGTGLSGWISAVSLLVGAAGSQFLSTRHLRRWMGIFWLRSDRADQILFLILLVGSAMCLLTNTGDVNGVWGTSNPDNLGDLPFHVHLIQFFARGAAFPPANPIFSGEPL